MTQATAPRRPQRHSVSPLRRVALDLGALHGDVHRFSGVVDRFGSFESGGVTIRTLCIRELQLDDNGTPIRPEHWWFRLREVWSEAGVRVGDTVVFTAKVQRCSKGWDDPASAERPTAPRRGGRIREQVMGFAASPRSVVVVRRREGVNHQLAQLGQELEQTTSQLELARDDLARLEQHRQAALQQADRIQRDLLASRDQIQRLGGRTRKLAALLLCLGSVGGFTLGWSSAQWKQASGLDATSVASQLLRR